MPEPLFNKVAGGTCNFIKKETLRQVFSCEFCEISKNTLFLEHVWAAASCVSYGNLNMAIAPDRYTLERTTKLWVSLGFCSVSSDNFFVVTYTCLSCLLLKPGPGPWTRTLKNLDPEKPGPEKP